MSSLQGALWQSLATYTANLIQQGIIDTSKNSRSTGNNSRLSPSRRMGSPEMTCESTEPANPDPDGHCAAGETVRVGLGQNATGEAFGATSSVSDRDLARLAPVGSVPSACSGPELELLFSRCCERIAVAEGYSSGSVSKVRSNVHNEREHLVWTRIRGMRRSVVAKDRPALVSFCEMVCRLPSSCHEFGFGFTP